MSIILLEAYFLSFIKSTHTRQMPLCLRSDIDLRVLDNTVFTQTGVGGVSIQEGGNGGGVGTAGGHV